MLLHALDSMLTKMTNSEIRRRAENELEMLYITKNIVLGAWKGLFRSHFWQLGGGADLILGKNSIIGTRCPIPDGLSGQLPGAEGTGVGNVAGGLALV